MHFKQVNHHGWRGRDLKGPAQCSGSLLRVLIWVNGTVSKFKLQAVLRWSLRWSYWPQWAYASLVAISIPFTDKTIWLFRELDFLRRIPEWWSGHGKFAKQSSSEKLSLSTMTSLIKYSYPSDVFWKNTQCWADPQELRFGEIRYVLHLKDDSLWRHSFPIHINIYHNTFCFTESLVPYFGIIQVMTNKIKLISRCARE